ncbi:MAG: hypothetical protein ACP5NB_00005, partial [Chloroflexia bacterium]
PMFLLLLGVSLLAGCTSYFASPSPQPEATRVMPPTDTPIPYPLPTQEPPPPPSPTPTPGPTPIVLGAEWAPEAEREVYISTTVVVASVGDGPGEVGYYVFPCPPGGEDCPLPIKAEKFTVDAHGNIYILDVVNKRVAKFDSEGRFMSNIPYGDIIQGAEDLAADADGHIYLYAPWEEVPKVVLLDPEGKFLWGTPAPSWFVDQRILAMRVDDRGTLWVMGEGFSPSAPIIDGQPYSKMAIPLGDTKGVLVLDAERQKEMAIPGHLLSSGRSMIIYSPTAAGPGFIYNSLGQPIYQVPEGISAIDLAGNLYYIRYKDGGGGYTIIKWDSRGRRIASFDLPLGIFRIESDGSIHCLTMDQWQSTYYIIRWQVKR